MTVEFREPINDKQVFGAIKTKLSGNADSKYNAPVDKQYVRAFSWLKNSDFPLILQSTLSAYIKWTRTILADPRDIIFISHIIFSLLVVVPSALTLLYRFNWIHAIIHSVMLVGTIPPFILMLHCTCHKKLGKTANSLPDIIVHYVLAPFFGETWNTFYYHHVKHHHIEDNGPLDLSSTIWYDRDDWTHFLLYFARFYLLIGFELPIYFLKKRQFKAAASVFFGEYSTLAVLSSFFLICENPLSVVFAFFVPLNFARLGMMTGNWTQHAFLDQDDPKNDYKTSITCIETPYNALCFNDGYHTSHHLNPIRHWQDHPDYLLKNADKFKDQNVVLFRGCDYWEIWCHLMIRDYQWLGSKYHDLSGTMSLEQKIDFLKSRTKRLSAKQIQSSYPNFDKIKLN